MRSSLLKKILTKKFISKNIPNIFVSIYFCKFYRSKYYTVIHKERKSGLVWIVKFKLLKFCFQSLFDLCKLRVLI